MCCGVWVLVVKRGNQKGMLDTDLQNCKSDNVEYLDTGLFKSVEFFKVASVSSRGSYKSITYVSFAFLARMLLVFLH